MRKWRFSGVLILLVLIVISGFSMAAEVRSSFSVNSNKSKVLVNGELTNFEAYNIDGFNYFKLRDIAKVVNGTNKQFNVTWDGSVGAINLLSGKSYVATGTELVMGDGAQKTAFFNSSSIYKDGKRIILGAFTINDNNFFKLRDLCQTFDIGVTWDAATSTIGIDTSISYVAPLKNPVWVTPNYTDDFDNIIYPAGEGYFVGLCAKSVESWDYVMTLLNDAMKPVLRTNYRADFDVLSTLQFSNGLMPVTTATEEEASSSYYSNETKYGYIDSAGNMIIPEKYFNVSAFKYGVACVHEMRNGVIFTLLIDTTGKVVWEKAENLNAVFGGDGQVRFRPTNEYVTLPENVLARHNGYWDYKDEWVETKNLTSADAADEAAFRSAYGNLYGKIEPLGYGFFHVENATHPIMEGVVNSKNVEIVRRGGYYGIETVYTDTSLFFVVLESDSPWDSKSVINSSGVKILNYVHQVYFAGGEAIWYFQHDAAGTSMYGLMESSGKDIAAVGYTFLTSQDPYNGIKNDYNELNDPGFANTRIYTAGNMQERVDLTDLKKQLAISQEIYNQINAIWDPEYKGQSFYDLGKYINRANALIAMAKPTWTDVSVTECWLSISTSFAYTVLENWNSR